MRSSFHGLSAQKKNKQTHQSRCQITACQLPHFHPCCYSRAVARSCTSGLLLQEGDRGAAGIGAAGALDAAGRAGEGDAQRAQPLQPGARHGAAARPHPQAYRAARRAPAQVRTRSGPLSSSLLFRLRAGCKPGRPHDVMCRHCVVKSHPLDPHQISTDHETKPRVCCAAFTLTQQKLLFSSCVKEQRLQTTCTWVLDGSSLFWGRRLFCCQNDLYSTTCAREKQEIMSVLVGLLSL